MTPPSLTPARTHARAHTPADPGVGAWSLRSNVSSDTDCATTTAATTARTCSAANVSIDSVELFASPPHGGNAQPFFGKGYLPLDLKGNGAGSTIGKGKTVGRGKTPRVPATVRRSRATPARGAATPAKLFPDTNLGKPSFQKTASAINDDILILDAFDAVRDRLIKKIEVLEAEKLALKEENLNHLGHVSDLAVRLDIAEADIAQQANDNFTLASALCATTVDKERAEATATTAAERRQQLLQRLKAVKNRLRNKGKAALERLESEVLIYKDHQIEEAKAFVQDISSIVNELITLAEPAGSPKPTKKPRAISGI